MKISRDWLSDFIEWIETDPDVIADQLTRCMGEVDEVERQGQFLDGVVVGKILTIDKHPQADRLSVCTVETDLGTKNVVCGGTNLKQGMLVAFAHVGTTVKAGGKEIVKLEQVKIRGVESEGMICAAEEIDIEHLCPPKPEDGGRPVADLSRLEARSVELTAGTPLREALSMNDVIFHIDNHAITNRPDLFSHIGVARELVAMGLASWKKKPSTKLPSFPKTKPTFTLKNDVPDLVPEYFGCVLTVEDLPETPSWMKKRLEATGWRSINLVVDITNYVLMEVGMPLHAFDVDDFRGTLHIRKAKKGESITTLDGVSRNLPEGSVIMSDDEGIFDLFGVMGGLRTSNKPDTKHIFVQAGVIQPASVRKTIIAMGHRTDASAVYEKGVNLTTAIHGLSRVVELFLALSPGTKLASAPIEWGKEQKKKPIDISMDLFGEFIGTPIPPTEVKTIFKNLGFDLKASQKKVSITPPSWRSDITMKQDLIEEVARIHRYANIPPTLPSASIVPPYRDHRLNMIRDGLREAGFYEFLHLAFSSPSALRSCNLNPLEAIALQNPIGEEMSLMRTSLVPAILETCAREIKTWRNHHLKVYECGRVFCKGKPERTELTLVIVARGETSLIDDPLLTMQATISALLTKNGYGISVEKSDTTGVPYGHPGRTGLVTLQGKNVGTITEVHPSVRENLGFKHRISIATIDLDTLLSISPETTIAKPLPVFPSVEFDETVPLPKTAYGVLLERARTIDPLLRSVSIVNLYEKGEERNITIRFEYRSDEKTLTQDEAEKVHAKVIGEIKKG